MKALECICGEKFKDEKFASAEIQFKMHVLLMGKDHKIV